MGVGTEVGVSKLTGVRRLSPVEDGAEDVGRTCGEERRGASSRVV